MCSKVIRGKLISMRINATSLPSNLSPLQKKDTNNNTYINKFQKPTFGAIPPYKVIDMNTWAGREVYEWFLNLHNPFCGVTTNVNVHALAQKAKEMHTTFNTVVLYAIAKAVNSIDQFRLRMVGGKLVQFERSCVNPPVPKEGHPGYFNFVNIDFKPDLDEFITHARAKITEGRTKSTIAPADRPDAVYLSHIKNHYTALNNPHNGNFDFTPRIVWGSPEEKSTIASLFSRTTMMPITVEAHHSIISGAHILEFFERFQKPFEK